MSSWARASRRLARKASAASRIPASRFCSASGGRGIWRSSTIFLDTSLNVAPRPLLWTCFSWAFSHQKRKSGETKSKRGTKLLKPWLVQTGIVLMATKPMGARELNRTDCAGNILAEQLFKPAFVIFRGVSLRCF